jgi:hypothetical protein
VAGAVYFPLRKRESRPPSISRRNKGMCLASLTRDDG